MTETRGRRKLGAASAAVAVAGTGVMFFALNPASPANAEPGNNNKYFVCKYVGTPGDDETLQTGQNPISVAGSAIPEDPVVVGSFFADAQGRSFVLALDNTPPGPDGDPDVSACVLAPPTTEPPATSEPPETSSGSEPSETETITDTAVVTSPGPVPEGVAAGAHSVSSTSVALGGLLMAVGVAGLLSAARPWKRGTH